MPSADEDVGQSGFPYTADKSRFWHHHFVWLFGIIYKDKDMLIFKFLNITSRYITNRNTYICSPKGKH